MADYWYEEAAGNLSVSDGWQGAGEVQVVQSRRRGSALAIMEAEEAAIDHRTDLALGPVASQTHGAMADRPIGAHS